MTDCQKAVADIRSIQRLGLDSASGEEPAPPRPAGRALRPPARNLAGRLGLRDRSSLLRLRRARALLRGLENWPGRAAFLRLLRVSSAVSLVPAEPGAARVPPAILPDLRPPLRQRARPHRTPARPRKERLPVVRPAAATHLAALAYLRHRDGDRGRTDQRHLVPAGISDRRLAQRPALLGGVPLSSAGTAVVRSRLRAGRPF